MGSKMLFLWPERNRTRHSRDGQEGQKQSSLSEYILSSPSLFPRSEMAPYVLEIRLHGRSLCRWQRTKFLRLDILKNLLNSSKIETLSSTKSCLFNAGITVGLMVLPQGIAYAELCDLPHQYGIYTALPGVLFYLMLGTAKDITVGPTAIVSLLVGNVTHSLDTTKYA